MSDTERSERAAERNRQRDLEEKRRLEEEQRQQSRQENIQQIEDEIQQQDQEEIIGNGVHPEKERGNFQRTFCVTSEC